MKAYLFICPCFNTQSFTSCCIYLFQNAVSMLKQEYKDGDINLENALQLAIKVLSKTLDMTKVTSEKGRSEGLALSL